MGDWECEQEEMIFYKNPKENSTYNGDFAEWLPWSHKLAEMTGEEVKKCADCGIWYVTWANYKGDRCIKCAQVHKTMEPGYYSKAARSKRAKAS